MCLPIQWESTTITISHPRGTTLDSAARIRSSRERRTRYERRTPFVDSQDMPRVTLVVVHEGAAQLQLLEVWLAARRTGKDGHQPLIIPVVLTARRGPRTGREPTRELGSVFFVPRCRPMLCVTRGTFVHDGPVLFGDGLGTAASASGGVLVRSLLFVGSDAGRSREPSPADSPDGPSWQRGAADRNRLAVGLSQIDR